MTMDHLASDPPRLPQGAQPPRLIVCERSGEWAASLRRELPARGARLSETRSLAECWQLLARSPSSFVVLELIEAGADALLDRLAHAQRRFPLASVAVVAERELADYEPLVREAGAVHFVASLRQCRPLAELACRHLDQAARPRRNLAEAIWARLPWGGASGS